MGYCVRMNFEKPIVIPLDKNAVVVNAFKDYYEQPIEAKSVVDILEDEGFEVQTLFEDKCFFCEDYLREKLNWSFDKILAVLAPFVSEDVLITVSGEDGEKWAYKIEKNVLYCGEYKDIVWTPHEEQMKKEKEFLLQVMK